jgi:hypothetical protein
MNADTGFNAHIVTAMDTKIRCNAYASLSSSTTVCINLFIHTLVEMLGG